MTDEEFTARFEAAKNTCFTGHEAGCTYGGLTPSGGYWLAAVGCELNHGTRCAMCGADTEAKFRFRDWQDRDGALFVWEVPACRPCADREADLHPETWRPSDAPESV